MFGGARQNSFKVTVNNLMVQAKSPHVGYRVKLVTMSAVSPVKA